MNVPPYGCSKRGRHKGCGSEPVAPVRGSQSLGASLQSEAGTPLLLASPAELI